MVINEKKACESDQKINKRTGNELRSRDYQHLKSSSLLYTPPLYVTQIRIERQSIRYSTLLRYNLVLIHYSTVPCKRQTTTWNGHRDNPVTSASEESNPSNVHVRWPMSHSAQSRVLYIPGFGYSLNHSEFEDATEHDWARLRWSRILTVPASLLSLCRVTVFGNCFSLR